MVEWWVPAHISGFFEPFFHEDPMRTGSRNCGPCLDVGVVTEVGAKASGRIRVTINGKTAKAPTTLEVVRTLARDATLRVSHRCEVPVGAGLGASGAGALGAAFAIADALGLPLPEEQLVRTAHRAEVVCRTGLGDVSAQALGALVLTLEPGAPPYGRWMRLEVSPDIRVVVCVLGGLKTRRLLTDEDFVSRCRSAGRQAFEMVRKSPSTKSFLRASRNFAESLGLFDPELRSIARVMEGAGSIGASQVMLGRAVFALVRREKLQAVKRALSDVVGDNFFVARIARGGPRRTG